ncbi:uncharacterized protein LOC112509773 [Cynara cardunculus var. scolymus]|uniref:uncharacterized protein LOC112509773 n=1 Tax=Cynara cardunculus var. scolymus TaxID=59895 RepID=UPI000D626D79|nr:uncharacterized protein LOC112509773 [Cynara cardunculus var. scolymus]
MKDKSVVTESPSGSGVSKSSFSSTLFVREEEESDRKKTTNDLPLRIVTHSGSSRYDFVKVKVWLGDDADHYYVLSRFLLSRMLTVTKIPNHVALKIALELKKLLVDNSLLDVSQSDLETNLFKLMKWRGYGQEYINRYKMMTRFHHRRVPLVILVCGTACVGKSTIATQLAQRLNLPNVLQTDMVYELLRTSTDAPLASTPFLARDFSSSEELITEFCRECRIVRKGLAGDLKKAMKDGKPIIIEGMHVDPGIYLIDEERKLPNNLPVKAEEAKSTEAIGNDVTWVENDASASSIHDENSHKNPENLKAEKATSAGAMNNDPDGLKSVPAVGTVPENITNNMKDQVAERKPIHRRENSGAPEPIIIPIVLKMAEFDHKALLEEWISTRKFSNNYPIKDKDKLISNLKTIQDYLCSFQSQGLTVTNISATTFPQTLDWLHNHLLQRIEQGISSASKGSNGQANES